MKLTFDTSLDRTLIEVNRETYARFVELVESPPNTRLRELLMRKAPWEEKGKT
jgi:uncharacterized protein (DUF1778 family)